MLVAIRDDERPVVRDGTFAIAIPPDGDITAMAVQPDGKLLIGGSFFSIDGFPTRSIARLNPNGSIDRTFNPHITAGIDGPVHALLLLPDGSVLIAGTFNVVQGHEIIPQWKSSSSVVRLRANGEYFLGSSPYGFPELTEALALQLDVKGSVLDIDT